MGNPSCREALLCFWVSLIFAAGFCYGNDMTVEVVGIGECADCKQNNIKTGHAFSGLRVTIDCKPDNGNLKTEGVGELDEEGKFKVLLPEEILKDGELKETCYAQLHSASATPCPTHDGLESSKIVFKSKTHDKLTFGLAGEIKFRSVACASAFLWPYFHRPPLPLFSFPHLPKFPHPPLIGHPVLFPPFPPKVFPPIYKKPCPPSVPIYKKPVPPPVPVYEKPLPPPVPIYKKPIPPPVPIYKKPHPPPVPIYKKPIPPPIYKPKPPVYKPPTPKVLPPPVPVYKKPLPPPIPIYKKAIPPPIYKPKPPVYKPPTPKILPPPVVYKKPLPPPVPVYKHPFFRHLPPIPKIHPFYKKPCPPLPKVPIVPKFPPKYFSHRKFGKLLPLPPLVPHP